jgi:hypothetical protein
MLEKEAKVKQKIWARATARWKANIRYSARQRRGKRIASTTRMSQAQQPSSLYQTPDRSLPSTPPVLSRALSRRSSMESLYATSSPIEATTDPPLSLEQEEPPPHSSASPIPSPSPRASSPPAYQQPLRSISEGLSVIGTGQSPATQHHKCARCDSHCLHTSGDSGTCLPLLHAHVATDDKTLLARLAQLASSPPTDSSDPSEVESSNPEVSAPFWQDEELDDFTEHSSDPVRSHISSANHPSRASSSAPLFPSPPSKGKMAAPAFYDYPYTFEDMTLEPDLGPAAPPFEAGPSAPPVDDIDLTPSAPPMEDDTYDTQTHASALVLGWGPPASPLPPEAAGPVRMGTHDQEDDRMSTNRHPQPHTPLPSLATDDLPPPIQGPVASDGTPPSYHL